MSCVISALKLLVCWQKLLQPVKHDSWPIQPDILSPPLLRLTSRKLLWLDLQPVDIKSRWRHNWKSAQVVNSHLVCDPTIRQPGFDLSRQQWSPMNNFCTEQGHCGACRRKWWLTDTNLCPCGEIQMMSHIVESCLLTKLNGGLPRLHSADEDAVSWLTKYKKKITACKNTNPIVVFSLCPNCPSSSHFTKHLSTDRIACIHQWCLVLLLIE